MQRDSTHSGHDRGVAHPPQPDHAAATPGPADTGGDPHRAPLPDATEMVSFDDPEENRTWVFDVSFLTSSWQCIFGAGCPGILTEPAPELEEGCCSYGAHLVDDADAAAVEAAASRLTDAQWVNRAIAGKRGGPFRQAPGGGLKTRLVDDVCIFFNPPGTPAGSGCALHRAALDHSERPMDWKPEVCWQVPVRRLDHVESDGHVTTVIRRWLRRDWGEGGEEFHWWCTEDSLAFTATHPVYVALRDELTEMVGPWAYQQLADHIQRTYPRGGAGVQQKAFPITIRPRA